VARPRSSGRPRAVLSGWPAPPRPADLYRAERLASTASNG